MQREIVSREDEMDWVKRLNKKGWEQEEAGDWLYDCMMDDMREEKNE